MTEKANKKKCTDAVGERENRQGQLQPGNGAEAAKEKI